MAPTSAGLFSVLRLNKFPNNFHLKIFIYLLALFTTLNCSVNVAKFNARLSLFSSDFETLQQRHKRATTESLLTVEWEGIQSGDHPDSSIRGFIVEYKAEGENQWNVHSGIIPYKGPNHQYRVQIPKLPTGISYFVRIKVLGSKGEVLVETPEIRAKNEIVSIHCEPEEITSPNNIKIKEQSKFSIAITWQPPECGSIGEYQLELKGLNLQSFDVHRQTVSQPQASISGLISGTEYSLRIRAIDRARIVGPWSEELITVSTKGELPEQLSDAQLEYISDKEVRISWTPLDHPRLQHYEVVISSEQTSFIYVYIVLTEIINSKQKNTKQHKEEEDDGEKVERTRVAPAQTNVYFGDLKPDTEYKIGVLAYIDHEPVRLQRLTLRTNVEHPISSQKPMVLQLESGEYEIHWKPQPELQYSQYILEYKLGNETKWYLLTKKEETNQQQQQSYSIKTTKLDDAISVRLLFIGEKEEKKKPILIAKTEESLVGHKSIGNSCERVASGEPKFLEEKEGEEEVKKKNDKIVIIPETIKFKWEQVKCEGHIEGWEYMIWPAEDGHQPLEGSVPEFTSHPQVLLQGLEPSTEYRFKVRHRLPHGGHGPWSPTASGRTKISKKGEEEKEEGGETSENIYRLRIALVPPRSFLVWTPLPEHAKRINRFKVSHKPTAPTLADGVTVEGPTEQFVACPPGISQPGVDFCLDLRGLELGRQYSAEIFYQLDGPTGKWSKKGAPLFFILVDEDVNKEEKGPQQQQLNIGQISIEQLEGKPKSVVHWTAEGPMLDQIRAYQVEIRGGPQQIWRPISGYVAAVRPGQKQFRVEIDSALLAGQAEIRLKALGSDGKPVVESLPLGTGKPCEQLIKY
uniref:Fibronectin type-III domain-containing protein n=1 Tax=Meloidogyne incognita TaxID=6306 RepID=A0A914MTK8_MELIC